MIIQKIKTSKAVELIPVIAVFGFAGAAVFILGRTIGKIQKLDLSLKEEDY